MRPTSVLPPPASTLFRLATAPASNVNTRGAAPTGDPRNATKTSGPGMAALTGQPSRGFSQPALQQRANPTNVASLGQPAALHYPNAATIFLARQPIFASEPNVPPSTQRPVAPPGPYFGSAEAPASLAGPVGLSAEQKAFLLGQPQATTKISRQGPGYVAKAAPVTSQLPTNTQAIENQRAWLNRSTPHPSLDAGSSAAGPSQQPPSQTARGGSAVPTARTYSRATRRLLATLPRSGKKSS